MRRQIKASTRLRSPISANSARSWFVGKSRLRKSEQGDKWSFCLTAGKIVPRIRRDDEQTSTPESLTGLQGEGGAGSHQGRPDGSPTGGAFRRSPQSDYGVEIAA